MIYGMGFDLCEVERMRTLSHKEAFIVKYFSDQEQTYISSKGAKSDQTMAGIFAAKEAFVKMLGTGFYNTDLAAVEILHDEQGSPYYQLHRWAKEEVEKREISVLKLSISHEKNMAGAVAIGER